MEDKERKENEQEDDMTEGPLDCGDCGAHPGELHHPCCDIQVCSVCGRQWISCGCKDHDPQFARWTGFWPGALEAKALGMDIGELDESGLAQLFFIKPEFEFEDRTQARD